MKIEKSLIDVIEERWKHIPQGVKRDTLPVAGTSFYAIDTPLLLYYIIHQLETIIEHIKPQELQPIPISLPSAKVLQEYIDDKKTSKKKK